MKTQRAKKGEGCLQKRGSVFYAVWHFGNKRYAVSTKETTEREARKRLKEIVESFKGKHNPEAVEQSVLKSVQRRLRGNLPISEAFAVYEQDNSRERIAESTMRVYRLRFARFARWAEKQGIDAVSAVTEQIAQRFMSHDAGTTTGKTYNDILSGLSATWKTFVEQGYAGHNPWLGIKRKDKATIRKEELTRDQLDALFDATAGDGEMRELIRIGLLTGLRLKDAATLRWSSVDLAGGFIRTIPEKTKRHHIKVTIPILPQLAGPLRSMREEDPDGEFVLPEIARLYNESAGKYVCNRLKTVFKHAGIITSAEVEDRSRKTSRFGYHSLRHTFLSALARANVPAGIVQEIAGHTNLRQTSHYTHIRERDLASAVSGVFITLTRDGAERPQEREDGGEVIDIPALPETPAETRLDALARLLADMDGDELARAAKIVEAETERRK